MTIAELKSIIHENGCLTMYDYMKYIDMMLLITSDNNQYNKFTRKSRYIDCLECLQAMQKSAKENYKRDFNELERKVITWNLQGMK